jgi:hypothetical protein
MFATGPNVRRVRTPRARSSGIAEIDDAQIVRIGNCEREVDTSGDPLIGSCITERLASEDIAAGSGFDVRDARFERENGQSKQEEQQN